jgi:hypothetical protein
MTRVERARKILLYITSIDPLFGSWHSIQTTSGFISFRSLNDAGGRWNATITPLNGHGSLGRTCGENALCCNVQSVVPAINLLDLWVRDRGKVLSLESAGDELRLRTMRSGGWEEIFGLAPQDAGPH